MRYEDLPKSEFAFPGPLRDRLVAAILRGEKTSTTGLLIDYELAGDPLPQAGELEVVVDSDDQPVALVQTIESGTCRIGDIDLQHAIDEGEGYESVEQWRAGHESFWHSDEMREYLGNPAFTVTDDTMAVTERFRVVERIWQPAQINSAFAAEATAMSAALRLVEEADFAGPTRCPPWTVKEEFAHTAIAISRTPVMLEGKEPDGDAISAASYYLPGEKFGPANATRVADAQDLATRYSVAELIDWFEEQARLTWRLVHLQPDERLVITRWGDSMELTDFQVTRVVELALHGLDIADALSAAPWLTEEASEVVEGLIVPSGAAALRTATGWSRAELLRKTTGRAELSEAERSEVDSRQITWLTLS